MVVTGCYPGRRPAGRNEVVKGIGFIERYGLELSTMNIPNYRETTGKYQRPGDVSRVRCCGSLHERLTAVHPSVRPARREIPLHFTSKFIILRRDGIAARVRTRIVSEEEERLSCGLGQPRWRDLK